jgi:SAM-dependent methyltransferase
MTLDLAAMSSALTCDSAGIWTTKLEAARVSFPTDGHGACFAVEDESFWFAHRNECIASAMARYPFSGPFLDVGGGNGIVSKRLAADGVEPVVLEPGPEGALNAKRRGLPHVVCATIEQAAFNSGAFGAAGLFDVIEHVEDDAALLARVREVLPAHGVLCVTVPAYTWLWSYEDVLAGHFRRYTVAELRTVLERSGFTVQYATYFFAPLTVPLFFLRSLRDRIMTNREGARERASSQHTPSAFSRMAMDFCLLPERRVIAHGGKIGVGTSCLAVALAR